MRTAIHYSLTALWGLPTPILMGYGAQSLLTEVTEKSEHIGHPPPLEYIVLFFFTMKIQEIKPEGRRLIG